MSSIQLKSGEILQIVRVAAPDEDWQEQILPFLGHKGEMWLEGLRTILTQQLPGLQVYFYLGLLGDAIAGNIMTTEAVAHRLAILGHVYTTPDHRRKGVCSALMHALTEDFVRHGGRGMTLGTGYDSPAFHIYHSFGFRSVAKTDQMIWEAEPGFMKSYFAPGATTVREICWADWALLDLLYKIEEGSFLRGVYYTQYGPSGYENQFLRLHKLIKTPPSQSQVLVKAGGEVVGHAVLLPDPRWQEKVLLLDLFIHTNFYQAGGALLEALHFPSGCKVQAYADSNSPEKMALLEHRGLHREAILTDQLSTNGQPLDVIILSTVV